MSDAGKIFSDSLDKSFSSNKNQESFKDLYKYKRDLGESSSTKKIKYIKPNFKNEFSELKRYRQLEDMDMDDWLTVAENGKVVSFDSIKDELKNVKFDLDKIPNKKKDKFKNKYDKGIIKLPIVVDLSDGLYLLGGNTRITGLLSNGKKPKVWLVKFNEKQENKESTTSGSSGQYSGSLYSKAETKEATTTASTGSYVTPAAWAKSTKKKDFMGASKPQIPGGKFVEIKSKCKKFPYCNQGDIKALNIHEDVLMEDKVNDILRKAVYLKKLKNEVGFLGELTTKQLFKGSSFRSEIKRLAEDMGYEDDITEKVKQNILYKIWERYANAMGRRRPDSITSLDSFLYVIGYREGVYIFKHGRSYIIGQLENGFFRVSHFAPNSMREGIDTLKELIKFNNVIFAVTDDLKDMLIKMGTYYSGMIFPMYFKGRFVEKHILSTDEESLKKISEYFSESTNFRDEPIAKKTLKYKEYPEAEKFLKRIDKNYK